MRALLLVGLCSCSGRPADSTAADASAADAGVDAAPDANPDVDAGPIDELPDVAEVEAPDGFVEAADGTFALATGFELRDAARTFYETHPDDFDFLVFWSDFDVPDVWAFTDVTKIDVAGIGSDRVHEILYGRGLGADYTADAGSDGRLQAIVYMNGRTQWQRARFDELDILTHEVGHRWGANLALPWEADPFVLVVDFMSHWSLFAGLGGASALSYGELVANGDGTFTSSEVRPMPYSPWDLYAMGLLPADEVPDLFFVRDPTGFEPALDPFGTPWTGNSRARDEPVTFTGERVDVTIEDVVAALGPRDPAFGESQTDFRFAFVVLCRRDRPCSDETLSWVDGVRAGWSDRFAWATGDRAAASTEIGE